MGSSLFGPANQTPVVGTTNNLQQIRNMMAMMQNSKNPQAMLGTLMNQNPQMQNVMNIINQYGGDAKTAFYETAKQKGIDPNQIINMLR